MSPDIYLHIRRYHGGTNCSMLLNLGKCRENRQTWGEKQVSSGCRKSCNEFVLNVASIRELNPMQFGKNKDYLTE